MVSQNNREHDAQAAASEAGQIRSTGKVPLSFQKLYILNLFEFLQYSLFLMLLSCIQSPPSQ